MPPLNHAQGQAAMLDHLGGLAAAGGTIIVVLAAIGRWIIWSLTQHLNATSAVTRDVLTQKIDAHEEINQKRHTDNQMEFRKLDVRLARIERNGNRPTEY